MTKTEAAILAKARTQRFVSTEMADGNGPQGGRISYGRREYRAISALVRGGLLTLVNTQRETSSLGNGATVHHYIIRAKLSDTAETPT